MLTKLQVDLMKHTISGASRNWFVTGYNTEDSKEFEKLITLGLAKKKVAPSWSNDVVTYGLTGKGVEELSNNT